MQPPLGWSGAAGGEDQEEGAASKTAHGFSVSHHEVGGLEISRCRGTCASGQELSVGTWLSGTRSGSNRLVWKPTKALSRELQQQGTGFTQGLPWVGLTWQLWALTGRLLPMVPHSTWGENGSAQRDRSAALIRQ